MKFISRMLVENYAMSVGTTATSGIGTYGNMDLPIGTKKRKIREEDDVIINENKNIITNDTILNLLNKYTVNIDVKYDDEYEERGILIKIYDNNKEIGKFSNYMTDDGQQNDILVIDSYRGQGIGILGCSILMVWSEDVWGGFQWDIRGVTKSGENILNISEDKLKDSSFKDKISDYLYNNI